jgi:hypothetical protein
VTQTILFKNTGNVTLYVDFSDTQLEQKDMTITIPEPLVILPNRVQKGEVGFCTSASGHLSCILKFCTKEEKFSAIVTGLF